jgi:F-type H+-transporting ATPase subunit alpha
MDVPVGEGLLGRVFDPLGRPLDGNGPLSERARLPLEQPAAPALKGPPSDEDLMRYFIEMQSIRPPQGLLEIPRDGDDLD